MKHNSCIKEHSYNDFFMNFANKTKLDIIVALRNKPMSVNEIAEKLGQEQSKVSHNLKKLLMCRVLEVEQKGKQRIYSLNKKTILPMLNLIDKHKCEFCPNKK